MLGTIYKIRNLINGKIYIGSSINTPKRKKNHFYDLKNNNHPNKYLQSSFNKYGEINFKFYIIEYMVDEDMLLEREQYWINKLDTCDRTIGYNINPIAGKPPTKYGKKHSEETKNKISIAHKGKCFRINYKQPESMKSKVSKKIINLDTEVEFKSIKDAGEFYNIDNSSIAKVCRGERVSAGGYKWEYKK